jgi:F-type H+-transporting ATPase subunit gamma
MPSTQDIRRRIRSVKNTAQITRAMQLVAASKMKRAQDSALQGRPYATLLAEILSALGDRASDFRHPFLEKRENRHPGILLIATDKGLCGPLNSNLFRLVTETSVDARFVSLGRKGTQFLSRARRDLMADFSISDSVRFAEVRPAVEMMIDAYVEERVDSLEIIYSRFVNTLVQEPTRIPLLPLEDLKSVIEKQLEGVGRIPPSADDREIHYEPDPEAILDELLNLYIKQEVYQMVLEAKASEHSARMVAMKTATDNANSLVDDLTLQYNKVRQASITQEILEIAAASFAST